MKEFGMKDPAVEVEHDPVPKALLNPAAQDTGEPEAHVEPAGQVKHSVYMVRVCW
jgi:hypothetical protein